jgi:hypothetical protein
MLEKAGVPTACICTDEFAPLGQAEAEALGMSTLPIVVIPHPLAGISADEVEHRGDAVLDEVIYVLTEDSRKLAEEYKGRYLETKRLFRNKSLFE